ncbi:transketolase, partial [bacterium]|nr:transketolase [bacterium]
MNKQTIDKIASMAKRMRRNALAIAFSAGNTGAHLGSGLSIIEIMAVLYGGILRLDPKNPEWAERDRFILSKGHGTLGYYTALAEAGIITSDELDTFEENGGFLSGQPIMNMKKGIEFSSGSLGLGLSLGLGVALAGRKRNKDYNVYVLVGDGECNEGSVWEAAMSASHFKLDNLIVIVDYNKMQSDGASHTVLDMGDLETKWISFGFKTFTVDGHNIVEMYSALRMATNDKTGKPVVII